LGFGDHRGVALELVNAPYAQLLTAGHAEL